MTTFSIKPTVGLILLIVLSACSGGDQKTTQDQAKAVVSEDAALCAAHGDPIIQCFICDSSLRVSGRL